MTILQLGVTQHAKSRIGGSTRVEFFIYRRSGWMVWLGPEVDFAKTLAADNGTVRFQGAARHDDHIHFQVAQ
ncbi:hypothetical protein [Pararhizobium sp. DWP3-4]|uniref:hypothetical protein n=1 Tax=Pararhizobium sp. DWP3-4 TaxID=2804565 RepID=UPI003CF01A82